MFGIGKKNILKIGALQVLFYVDAAVHGSHGKIKVSHRKHNLREQTVNFVFVGPSTAPELTPALMEHIWQQAYAQGYIPHALVGCLEDNIPMEQVHQPAPAAADVPAVWRTARQDADFGHKTGGFDAAQRSAAIAGAAA